MSSDKKTVWDYLQKVSPWTESNDMPWVDEIICGIDQLVEEKSDWQQRFKEAADLLACVSQQVGNAAPDDRRHCLTPEVRDGISAILKGLRPRAIV